MVLFPLCAGLVAACIWALLVLLWDSLSAAHTALTAAEIDRMVAGRRARRVSHSIPLSWGDE